MCFSCYYMAYWLCMLWSGHTVICIMAISSVVSAIQRISRLIALPLPLVLGWFGNLWRASGPTSSYAKEGTTFKVVVVNACLDVGAIVYLAWVHHWSTKCKTRPRLYLWGCGDLIRFDCDVNQLFIDDFVHRYFYRSLINSRILIPYIFLKK